MPYSKGKLIVIDGLDGCGKSTQLTLAKNYLQSQNRDFKIISFPNYDNPSSALVKMYLNGEFSQDARNVNPFAASSFYAVDRFASFKLFWQDFYSSGGLIIAARYTTSNAIHQMPKLPKNQWNDYLNWLYDYEYQKLALPAPDKVIFLDISVKASQMLLDKRYSESHDAKDIHEQNIPYLEMCRNAAIFAAQNSNPQWDVIDCSYDDFPLPPNEVSNKIIRVINEVLR